MTTYLSLEDLLSLTNDLEVGPVRDLGLLDSAAHRPQAELIGYEAYPTLGEKAAVTSRVDRAQPPAGRWENERLGWLAAVVFYGLDDEVLEAPDDDAYDMVVAVASEQLDYQAAAGLLAGWPGVRLLRGE